MAGKTSCAAPAVFGSNAMPSAAYTSTSAARRPRAVLDEHHGGEQGRSAHRALRRARPA
jgi:hypothetical protein